MAARRSTPGDLDNLPSTADAIELRAVPNHDDQQNPPHDTHAEQALLGAALLTPETLEHLVVDDLYHPKHQTIAQAIHHLAAAGDPVTPITVATQLRASRELERVGGGPYLHELISLEVAAPPSQVTYYARIINEHAQRRRLIEIGTRLTQRARTTANPDDLHAGIWDTLTDLENNTTTTIARQPPPDIDTFLTSTEPPYRWLIPEFLEHQDRLILTAGEGHGKSTLLRQLAVQAAAGIHPFTYEAITPIRVLVLDLENSPRQNRREYRPLRVKAGRNLNPDQLLLEHRLDGIDLTTDHDQRWLDQLIATTKPDLLITGPIYKMATGDPNEEKSAKPIAMHLDHLRAEHGITVCLEAHSPKAVAGTRRRPHEPYGWSGWMRWPEFGLWLDGDGSLTPWRGSRDSSRTIPAVLTRGGQWPWTVQHDEIEIRWLQIRVAIVTANKPLTERQIVTVTGLPKTTVHRTIEAKRDAYDALTAELKNTTDDTTDEVDQDDLF